MNDSVLRRTVRFVALFALTAGAFGMFFCFPFLWSGELEDLVGARLPFIGGALLFSSGLISLALLASQQTEGDLPEASGARG